MPTRLLDPTDERVPLERARTPLPRELQGPIGLLDIAKPRGDVFLAHLAERMRARVPSIEVLRVRKPTFTKPAPEDLRLEIARSCAAVIEALAD